MSKLELNYHDRLDRMQLIMKTRSDNDVIYCKGVIYVEYDTKLLTLDKQCAICDENETRQ